MEDPNQMENLAHKEDPTYMEGCKILPATMLTTPGALKSTIPAGRVTEAVLLLEVLVTKKTSVLQEDLVQEDSLVLREGLDPKVGLAHKEALAYWEGLA